MYIPWYVAHLMAMNTVTTKMAEGFFRGCGIDSCEELGNINELDISARKRNLTICKVIHNSSAIINAAIHSHIRNKRSRNDEFMYLLVFLT